MSFGCRSSSESRHTPSAREKIGSGLAQLKGQALSSSWSSWRRWASPQRLLMGSAILMSLWTGACSPQPKARYFKPIKMEFGPTQTEVDLGELKPQQNPSAASLTWQGEIATEQWMSLIEDLTTLALQRRDDRVARLVDRMRLNVEVAGNVVQLPASRSFFASAAIGETREDVADLLAKGIRMLGEQAAPLRALAAARSSRTNWPRGEVSVEIVVDSVTTYLQAYVADVQAAPNVDAAVKEAIAKELTVNFIPRLGRIRREVIDVFQERDTVRLIQRVQALLRREGVELGRDTNQRLEMAERLVGEVRAIHDARSALAVLVEFWRASSQEVRDTRFKPVSPALYDFLTGKSESQLECIRTGCIGITGFARFFFVLPEIDSYGVPKLKQDLAVAAHDAILSEMRSQAVAFLPSLHEEVANQIDKELNQQITNLRQIARDYPSFFRIVLDRMATAKLGLLPDSRLGFLEASRLQVELAPGAPLKASSADRAGGTGAAALGASMKVAVRHYEHIIRRQRLLNGENPYLTTQGLGRLLFREINKVLSIGGYRMENLESFPALALGFDATRTNGDWPRLNLRRLSDSDVSFAVPDRLQVQLGSSATSNSLRTTPTPEVPSVSVRGQAELLKGLSRLTRLARDWEPTAYDPIMGSINAADFLPDLPRDAVNQRLFPKDLIFAASLGNAGVLLQNLTKKSSPVMLIGAANGEGQRRIKFADQVGLTGETPSEPTSALAAIVDVTGSERGQIARTGDVARYILALAEFSRSVEGLEKTKSAPLLESIGSGKTAVEQILDAREDLKLLVMAMSNFLASEMVDSRGLLMAEFDRTSVRARPRDLQQGSVILDHAWAIRALMEASSLLGAQVYKTSALDLYRSLLRHHFHAPSGFFRNRPEQAPTPEEIVAMLVAGEAVHAQMSPLEQRQWRQILATWMSAWGDLAQQVK
ncbi:MAG TPA: hypothetical protein PLZ57_01945 [Pseudobdellovibrionaceae bacterium]|nr:hypothetical protein [Pseudobdellovibrionaceae bacterium]